MCPPATRGGRAVAGRGGAGQRNQGRDGGSISARGGVRKSGGGAGPRREGKGQDRGQKGECWLEVMVVHVRAHVHGRACMGLPGGVARSSSTGHCVQGRESMRGDSPGPPVLHRRPRAPVQQPEAEEQARVQGGPGCRARLLLHEGQQDRFPGEGRATAMLAVLARPRGSGLAWAAPSGAEWVGGKAPSVHVPPATSWVGRRDAGAHARAPNFPLRRS